MSQGLEFPQRGGNQSPRASNLGLCLHIPTTPALPLGLVEPTCGRAWGLGWGGGSREELGPTLPCTACVTRAPHAAVGQTLASVINEDSQNRREGISTPSVKWYDIAYT